MRMHRLVAAVALATLVAACDNAVESSQKDGKPPVAPPNGPSLSVGPTAQVVVHCPLKVQVGTGGQCYACGLDSLGFYADHIVDSWSSSSISILVVSSSGQLLGQTAGTATITAIIDGNHGEHQRAGPHQHGPHGHHRRHAGHPAERGVRVHRHPQRRHGPFTYTWSVTSGSASGTASGDTWSGSSSVANASFVLKVVATDVDGRKASDTQSVFVHSGGSC